MATSLYLLPVNTPDVEVITRSVDIPVMQNRPLFRTMFRTYSTMSSAAWDVMMQWYIDWLEEALE